MLSQCPHTSARSNNMKNNLILKKLTLILLLSAFITGCASVTVRPHGGPKDNSQAHYVESMPFYFGGIIGNRKVNVNEACEGAEVTQMQTITTLSDWVLGAISISIYTPRTAKVWCEKSQ